VAAATATRPAVSARKGVSARTFSGADQALAASGAGWYYTWSTTHAGLTTPAGVQFVPMIWGAASVTDDALAQARANGPDLLTFNEPDRSDQANLTPTQALNLWPQLMASGMTLGSPSVSSGATDPSGWLGRFMSGAAARGYRVDFITLHWYASDFSSAASTARLRGYIQAVYNRYHRPIWLTEYALINFAGGASHYPSDAQQAAFITASTQMLDGLPYLARYAWFTLPAKDTGPSTGLYHSGARPTAAGRAFAAAR
ncbi:MAG: glycosyl hydrolase, partial [Frankia sp.]